MAGRYTKINQHAVTIEDMDLSKIVLEKPKVMTKGKGKGKGKTESLLTLNLRYQKPDGTTVPVVLCYMNVSSPFGFNEYNPSGEVFPPGAQRNVSYQFTASFDDEEKKIDSFMEKFDARIKELLYEYIITALEETGEKNETTLEQAKAYVDGYCESIIKHSEDERYPEPKYKAKVAQTKVSSDPDTWAFKLSPVKKVEDDLFEEPKVEDILSNPQQMHRSKGEVVLVHYSQVFQGACSAKSVSKLLSLKPGSMPRVYPRAELSYLMFKSNDVDRQAHSKFAAFLQTKCGVAPSMGVSANKTVATSATSSVSEEEREPASPVVEA